LMHAEHVVGTDQNVVECTEIVLDMAFALLLSKDVDVMSVGQETYVKQDKICVSLEESKHHATEEGNATRTPEFVFVTKCGTEINVNSNAVLDMDCMT